MMSSFDYPVQWILGVILVLSSLGVILARKPVHSSLSFLLTLMSLAALYLQLSAPFIASLQVLVYAGAILVIFIFVIVLFQDAHEQLQQNRSKSIAFTLGAGGIAFISSLVLLSWDLIGLTTQAKEPVREFGTVEAIGKAIYLEYFFPFEAVILLFLVAIIGALYIGRKVEQ